MHHKTCLIWLTGLSGAGKSTLASLLYEQLVDAGMRATVLDGDRFRAEVSQDLGFSREDRRENVKRAGEVCDALLKSGMIVIAAFVSPYVEDRNVLRDFFGDNFIEVYVKCSLEECRRRDPKGLYTRADRGDVLQFTGVSDVYEPPLNPEVIVDTEAVSSDVASERLFKYVSSRLLSAT
jgi:adenylylsulfate kinase